ncbi:UvrD-helicase domain-containing protein [Deinococcus peraridilitoris]|uniref:DNA 3'-5' helicase n=1 Tax=Deinococcus peraridilitoris (strain DSM 19664 / LMG 22246 / CIP 109416 / KR-200) TaxID=937777 RepID=K9ZYR3_DEIPD|nr:UvrD-helicase domain-containing protein [Deinococcus peraridilitoris]AFZ66721.1 ATP-dependent exonuclase V beta subunit, helicase and exonuclease domain-containing [Deinococcus peraridilitoris DSM 19664]
MTLTNQQARAAAADGSVAVVAGAGSGKTHMLVARFLHHLDAHGLTPLQIVAVTFTEKAAVELRARVRRAVQLARPDDFDTLAELDAAQISTIHALCARILRDHPEAAGILPGARILDEQQTQLWLAGQYGQALASLPERVFQRIPYSRMSHLLGALLADPIAAERAFQVSSEHWATWAAQAQTRAVRKLTGSVAWQNTLDVLRAFTGADHDRIESARREAIQHATALPGDPTSHAAGLLDVKLTGGSAKNWPDGGLSEVKDAVKTLRKLTEDALKEGLTLTLGPSDTWLEAALPDLREAFELVRAFLAERKRREGLLDYADLEVYALHALRDPDVRAHYARRWRAFLLDEFQDTNPIQDEILRLLRGDARTTIVGDEKQSIYGFRRADVRLFRLVRQDIAEGGGEEVQLDLSFRTHRALVEQSNAIFAPLLGDLHAPLQAAREAAHAPGSCVEAYLVQADATSTQLRRAEGTFIARRIQELLGGGFLIQGEDGPRPVRRGDIAVLSRTWGPLEGYGAALNAAGIPVVQAGGGSLLETRQALDALGLLTAVALHDPLAIIGTLRSPFCAVSDRTLQELHLAREDRSWLDVLDLSEDPAVQRARQLLRTLQSERRALSLSRLLQLADRLTGYTAVLANLWNAERRLADWRGTLDFIRSLERGEEDVFPVVRRLGELVSADLHVPRPVLEAGDAVTLLTMHGAKGLEWPVVIVADLGWTPPSSSNGVLFSPEYGVACREGAEEAEPPVVFAVMNASRAEREDAEARRLLYVALTRARDHLILTASGNSSHSLLALLEPGLGSAGVSITPVIPEEGDLGLASLGRLPTPAAPREVLIHREEAKIKSGL